MDVYISNAVLTIGDKADFYVYFSLNLCAVAKDFLIFKLCQYAPENLTAGCSRYSRILLCVLLPFERTASHRVEEEEEEKKEKEIFMYDEMSILHVSNCPQQHPFLLILNDERLSIST